MSLSTWNLCLNWPTPFEKRRLRPISVYIVSTVRAGKKCSIVANMVLPTRFPTSYRWSAYVTPKHPAKKRGSETLIRCFTSKTDILWTNLCYKVSLCLNFQIKRIYCSWCALILRITLDVNPKSIKLRAISLIAEVIVQWSFSFVNHVDAILKVCSQRIFVFKQLLRGQGLPLHQLHYYFRLLLIRITSTRLYFDSISFIVF